MTDPAPAAEWRLFLALWPDAAALAALLAHQALWSWSGTARLTRAERLHVTLHFIGNVHTLRVAALQQALAVPKEAFALEFTRPTVWAGSGGLAVIEPEQVPPALLRLHARLADALGEQELPVEGRRFRPHVTLARRAGGSRPPADAPAVPWHARGDYLLMRTAGGGRYETVQAFG